MKVMFTDEFEEDMRELFSSDAQYVTLRWYRYITKGFWKDIKAFYQRGRRGYADSDCWGLNEYLSSWLPEALRTMIDTKKGGGNSYPGGNITAKKWNEIVEKIALGFEAERKMGEELIYKGSKFEKLDNQRKEGFKLFVKWYGHLWD